MCENMMFYSFNLVEEISIMPKNKKDNEENNFVPVKEINLYSYNFY